MTQNYPNQKINPTYHQYYIQIYNIWNAQKHSVFHMLLRNCFGFGIWYVWGFSLYDHRKAYTVL